MSATHTDRATAQRAEIHVGLSDRTLTELAVRSASIPTQRAGSTYKQVVLDTQTDDLADLFDLVPIPTLAAFVKTQPEGEGQ